MSNYPTKRGPSGNTVYWLVALGLLLTGAAAPLAVLMIVLKLLDRKKPRGRHPYCSQQSDPSPTSAQIAAPTPPPAKRRRTQGSQKPAPLDEMVKSGKRLTRNGAILAGCFGAVALFNAVDDLWMLPDLLWYLEGLLLPLCLTCGGLGVLLAGIRRSKKARRCRSYLAVIGKQPAVALSELASAAGVSSKRVRDDLDDMLDDGFFPRGYLDYGSGQLVLSPERRQPKPEPESPAPQAEDAILTEIRAVNDEIADPKLSQQIDRIGTITAKILEYQKSHPDRSPQLHSFLSYYLPTTLKILRAYGQLESQEIEGQNIAAAMARIEGMMDKVVAGFEKQLDLLFQGDAMDITADVAVLEQMLAKDGLSSQHGLTLGG